VSQQPKPDLSLSELVTERDARRQRAEESERHLKQQEQLADYRKRLESYQITDANRHAMLDKVRQAFERGDIEVMFMSFPSGFCTDNGRAIINAGEPPINVPHDESPGEHAPEWVSTLPAGLRPIYDFWREKLKPGGFGLSARIINFPDGKPGDVGLFFTWARV
jgi:hypothetical protein